MLSSMYRVKKVEPDSFISPKYTRVGSKQVAKKGSLVLESCIETIDFAKANSQYSYKDFSLSNIIALGNESLLRPCSMDGNNLDSIFVNANTALNEMVKETAES